MLRKVLVLIAGLAVFNSTSVAQLITTPKFDFAQPVDTIPWVDSVVERMTVDEQIGQLLMVAAYSNKSEEHAREIENLIRHYHIGGLIFFQGGPVRQANLTNRYQKLSEVPLMLAMDAEWGLSMRLDSTMAYPRQMMLGAVQHDSLIYQMGADIAEQLKRLGIQISFSPVVDVNNNINNPVINSRSFGEEKFNVSEKGLAYMRGLQDNGVMAVAKHFPGHGDTDADSHKTLPTVPHDRTRLDSLELYPFGELIDEGVGGMMVAHLNVPALTGEEELAGTLSGKMVNGVLKEQMGFRGLVFTDALNMQGVLENNKPGDIECKALQAGNDVLLFPKDVPKAVSKIKRMIRRDEISLDLIEEKCRKVLYYKYLFGLPNYDKSEDFVETARLHRDLHPVAHEVSRIDLVENAMTLLRNEQELIPLQGLQNLKIASLTLGETAINPFQNQLSTYAAVDHFVASQWPAHTLMDTLKNYNLVIIGIHSTSQYPYRKYGFRPGYTDLIERISTDNNVILSLFGNPYSLQYFQSFEQMKGLIVAYEDTKLTQQAAAQLIFGGIEAKGKLPVSVNPHFKAVEGLHTKKIRLHYTIPEKAGFSSEKLSRIDSIINVAIEERAMPGCQVLVAKDGNVFYRKVFGHHTYMQEEKVHTEDLYDIASITKIAGTVPALMRLYEMGSIDLEGKLGDYLPYLDTSNKADLVLKDILVHQAGLKPWIPFYIYTLTGFYPDESLISAHFSEEYPYKVGNFLYLARNYRYRNNVFSNQPDSLFQIQLANDLFMNYHYKDTIYNTITASPLLEEKEYRYSDLGYYYFYEMIEQITGQSFPEYLERSFYRSLGLNNTCFNAWQTYPKERIVPTENDQLFRRQMLRGYVHDPGAAMLGGVCGHAGLFSTMDDLSKMMQMYLNGGRYGGVQYFDSKTIERFTSAPYLDKDNRRGLGFDKPQMDPEKPGPTCNCVSAKSFGHTGFTGTMVWADPEDNLLYVFLSNRVHPDQDNGGLVEMNIRTEIQRFIHEARLDSLN